MKRILTASAIAGLFLTPAVASAASPGLVRQYDRTYSKARRDFGPAVVGCRLTGGRGACRARATDARLRDSLSVLERLWAPPPSSSGTGTRAVASPAPGDPAPPRRSYAPPAAPSAAPGSYGGGYSIPSSIVQCESGGNWSAVNLSSGAGGAYQILPSTWQAYGGTGSPQDASPAEQSAVAARIYAASGGSAWVCK